MSEMVDRVAEAILNRKYDGGYTHLDIARTAIEAMREPTEAMCDAEHDSPGFGMISMSKSNALEYSDPDIVWRAMIDEALR